MIFKGYPYLMKILFASHIPNQHIKDKDPLGIMCLSATLKRANHEVRICSPEILETEQMLEDFPADVIAYSVATGEHAFYVDFNRVVKKRHKNLYSVFGGPHCTYNPDFITENFGVDAMAVGEVDLGFVDFINDLESGGNYHLTPNFHVRREDEIYRNEESNLIPDLNELPYPDRSIIYDYYPKAAASKVKSFMSMRGCPYPCTYCHNHKYNEMMKGKGNILRRRSVDHVVDEVLGVSEKYPLELVYFRDDSFNLGADWIEEFSEQYSKRVGIPFVCTSHLNAMTDSVARNLKKAGCVTVEVGVEAGSERVRNQILKRHMKDQTIIEGVKILQSNGIQILAENILGNPGTTLEEDLETFSLNKKIKVTYVNARMLQPLYGTDIYKTALKENELTADDYKDGGEDKISYYTGDTIVKVTNATERKRLNKLISVSVGLRLPLALVKVLIRLPLESIYSFVHIVYRGYAGSKMYPYRLSLKEKISTICDVLRMGRSNIDQRLGESLNEFLEVEKLDNAKVHVDPNSGGLV